MEIVRAHRSDHAKLSALTYQSKSYWGYSEEQMELWRDELTILPSYFDQFEVYKLIDSQGIIGYYAFEILNSRTAYLDNLFIDLQSIGNGLGSFLLADAEKRLSEKGINVVKLISDPNAASFYERQGFYKTGQKESLIPGRYLIKFEKNIMV